MRQLVRPAGSADPSAARTLRAKSGARNFGSLARGLVLERLHLSPACCRVRPRRTGCARAAPARLRTLSSVLARSALALQAEALLAWLARHRRCMRPPLHASQSLSTTSPLARRYRAVPPLGSSLGRRARSHFPLAVPRLERALRFCSASLARGLWGLGSANHEVRGTLAAGLDRDLQAGRASRDPALRCALERALVSLLCEALARPLGGER